MAPPGRAVFLDTLDVLLPGADETLFLRACLLPGEPGRTAWRALGPARRVAPALKLHRALLYRALSGHDAEGADGRLLASLRLAYAHEQFRADAVAGIVRDVVGALEAAGVRAAIAKGVAVAGTAFPDPALRHAHDLDLVLAEEDVPRAAAALRAAGLAGAGRGGSRRLALAHGSGFPIVLHGRFVEPPYAVDVRAVLDRAVERTICGVRARALAPDDALVHVLAHAATSWVGRGRLHWAVDAWHLVRAAGAARDWGPVVSLAAAAGLARPFAALLAYLARALDAPVPPAALDALRAAAAADGADPGADLDGTGAGCGPGGRVGRLLRLLGASRSWPSRVALARWAARSALRRLRIGAPLPGMLSSRP